jgi:hypothetical protein
MTTSDGEPVKAGQVGSVLTKHDAIVTARHGVKGYAERSFPFGNVYAIHEDISILAT